MSGLRSRRKGRAGEQELARILRERFPDAQVERSWQVRGGQGRPDVVASGLPLHIEVKRQARPNARAALRQAEKDSVDSGTVPVACTRADRDEWIVTLRLGDFLDLIDRARDNDTLLDSLGCEG